MDIKEKMHSTQLYIIREMQNFVKRGISTMPRFILERTVG